MSPACGDRNRVFSYPRAALHTTNVLGRDYRRV
jgi:hypothetical protein